MNDTPHPPLRGTLSPLRGARDLSNETLRPAKRGEGGAKAPDEGRISAPKNAQ